MNRSLFFLLCLSVWINYMDRGNLSVAAPALQLEMGLTPTELGILLSGFFWTYSLLQPVAGWLVDRYDVYRLYAAGFALWSLAVSAGGLANGFAALMLSRFFLGAGESLAYPAYSRILAGGFSERQRGFANAMIDVGTKAGPALGTLLGGFVVQAWGWRWFFFGMGALSLIWLVPWMRTIPAAAPTDAPRTPAPTSGAIFRHRQAWVTFFGLFCFNYTFYFLLTWLPSYLVTERKFSLRAMAVYGALPFCATAATSLAGGIWADRQIQAGAAAGPLGRRVAVIGLLICGLLVQPTLFDSTRAPRGKHIAWAYCHVPNGSTRDMTAPIEDQIERYAPGFRKLILARSVMPPSEIERRNANYVGGDIGSGSVDWRQFFTRPTRTLYSTPAEGIYICSAATPPGVGVHGMCGYFAAQRALHRELRNS